MQPAFATKSGGHESNEIRKSPALVPTIETLLICRVVAPWLVSVTDCGALVVPVLCDGKAILLLDRVTTVPVPAICTIWGLAPPSSKKLSVALSGPISEGRNFTVTVQVVFPAKLLPHVFEAMMKSPAFVPAIVIPVKFNVVVLWLVTVTVRPTLVVLTSCGEKLRAEGDSVTAVPVPLRLTVCGLPLALSLMLRVPLRVPTAVGLNATLIVQLVCGARLLPQVFAGIMKSPEATMLLMASVVVPVFLRTTLLEALVLPSTFTPKAKLVDERLTIGNP